MIRWYSTHHDIERKFGLINNDVYAGADGNVYKNESNGNWSRAMRAADTRLLFRLKTARGGAERRKR
jgi:hypothetical protein